MENKVTIKFKEFTIETDGTVDITIDGDKISVKGKPVYNYILGNPQQPSIVAPINPLSPNTTPPYFPTITYGPNIVGGTAKTTAEILNESRV